MACWKKVVGPFHVEEQSAYLAKMESPVLLNLLDYDLSSTHSILLGNGALWCMKQR